MGLPYFAETNEVTKSTTAVTARTSDAVFGVGNLRKNQLNPPWRSGDRALVCDGVSFAYVADDADFDIVGDFTLEGLINITTLDTSGIITRIYDKGTSIYTAQIDNELRLSLFGSVHSGSKLWTIPAIGWYRFKWAYDVATAVVTLHINGTGETGNLSSTGDLDPGEAIGTNSDRVTIGARPTGTHIFTGKIAYIGIAPAKYDNGAYLDPALCAGYWPFDSSDLTDSSGNGHTLTSSIGLSLNGTDEFASHADDAHFDLAGDFTFEAMVDTAVAGGTRYILSKHLAYHFRTNFAASQFDVLLYNSGVSWTHSWAYPAAGTYRIKWVYDVSAAIMTLYVNGVDETSNLIGSGTPFDPGDAIDTNTNTLYVGVFNAASGFFDSTIHAVGFKSAEEDNGAYLVPSTTNAYWDWNAGDLTDSSGNGHTLTGTGLESSNFVDDVSFEATTAYQWLAAELVAAAQPTLLFIPKTHNISTGAEIILYSGDWHATGVTNPVKHGDTISVTAGQAVVHSLSAAPDASTFWWIEIHDPDNTAEYIEVPYVFIGEHNSTIRSFLRGYSHGDFAIGTTVADSAGGFTSYPLTDRLWRKAITFRALPADKVILEAVLDEAYRGRPFVFCEDIDNEATQTRLVYWRDAMNPNYQNTIQSINMITLQLQEAGGGL